jgi:hypothetical protein
MRVAIAAALVASLAAAGCEHAHVADMGSGQHSLTAVAPSGGYDGSREEAIQEANDYCGKSRQQPVIDGFYDKPELGPHGEHTSSIIFKCATPKTLKF